MANKQYPIPTNGSSGSGGGGGGGVTSFNTRTGAVTTQAGDVTWDQLGNAAGNLTLANAAFATTFNQTSAVNWTWANTTVATIATTNASPILNILANYWTGAASATDTWTVKTTMTAGATAASTLTVSHPSGSPTAKMVLSSNVSTATNATGITLNNGATSWGATSTTQRGVLVSEIFTAASGAATFNALEVDLSIGASAGTGVLSGVKIALIGDNTYTSPSNGLIVTGDGGTYFQVAGQAGGTATTTVTGILALPNGSSISDTNNSLGIIGQGLTNSGSGDVIWGSAVAKSNLTAQAAAKSATTIYAVPAAGAGMYKVNYVASITTVDGTSAVLGGANGFQVIYTDINDSVVKTSNPTTPVVSAVNATGTTISGALFAYAKASTNIQYAFGYTGVGGQMRYDLSVYVEYIGP